MDAVVLLPAGDLVLGDDFRLDDDPQQITELATSIRRHGVLQPLLVRPHRGGAWEVVAGRRRLAAAREAGLDVVPCSVHRFDDDEAADVALTENLCRRDLSPVEKGIAIARMRDRGLNQYEIAQRVGYSQAVVSQLLTLLTLPAKIRDKVHQGKLSYTTAVRERNRPGHREGGANRAADLTGKDAQLVSHWRRRHDRLVAGIYAVLKDRQSTLDECRTMLDRLLKVDKEPLPAEETTSAPTRRRRARFEGAA